MQGHNDSVKPGDAVQTQAQGEPKFTQTPKLSSGPMVTLASGMKMLPPAPGLCQVCATKHEERLPHNQQSLYYQMAFHAEHGRWPTWHDAARHCTDDLRAKWFEALEERGHPVGEDVAAPAAAGGAA